jgi:hypothetical protein
MGGVPTEQQHPRMHTTLKFVPADVDTFGRRSLAEGGRGWAAQRSSFATGNSRFRTPVARSSRCVALSLSIPRFVAVIAPTVCTSW